MLEGLVGMINIGIYGSLWVKKFRNWKTGIHIYERNSHSLKKKLMTASQDIERVLTLIYLL